MHAKRGDIVQNVAIDPFGNVGKLIQDGKFLRDFSFTYDIVGHLPVSTLVMFSRRLLLLDSHLFAFYLSLGLTCLPSRLDIIIMS